MIVRQANVEDAIDILEINKMIDYGNPEEFIRESIILEKVYVCILEEKIVGFLLYQKIWGNTIFLSLIKILPRYQRQWLWSKLLAIFESNIKESWYVEYVSSTEKRNKLSQKFHEKHNFKIIWDLNMSHGNELFYMKKI